ncbi:hypothetical protein AB0L80_38720 [Streptomyces sp. NPDC052069]|uniref:hypothetical protein n=1 Tax=Streptomyces sp. NPDC052069 TaxID=3154650 RepID=UPI00344A551C
MTNPNQLFAKATTRQSYKVGDYVLYRDPARFWAGKSGHTFVCRVSRVWTGTYTLGSLTGHTVFDAVADYMRLLPPLDAMHDIDTAPLRTDGGADDMTAAAVAWLTEQHATATRSPDLPAQR